ncbi:MAG: hypothetical protein J5758_05840 [Abditibacteriota bacterium]|nr:hypothetical protein [Abditibacteriota bacterium]
MNKPATIGLLALLALIIIFGKFHNQMFPRHAGSGSSRVTVRVPANWIYSKGTEDYAFQLIIPGKRLAEPAGFITAKSIPGADLKGYVAQNTENKGKTAKKDYREKTAEDLWLCTYTAKDKNKEARAAEYVIAAPGCLWHLVGVFDESWFRDHGGTAQDFVKGFARENLGVEIPSLPEQTRQPAADTPEERK